MSAAPAMPNGDKAVRTFLFMYRRPDITPEAFRQYYETKHMPLLKSLAGKEFPSVHRIRYVTEENILFGESQDFPFDALLEIEFEDQAHFDRFTAVMYGPEAKPVLEADEEHLVDMTRMTGLWQLQEFVTWGAV